MCIYKIHFNRYHVVHLFVLLHIIDGALTLVMKYNVNVATVIMYIIYMLYLITRICWHSSF